MKRVSNVYMLYEIKNMFIYSLISVGVVERDEMGNFKMMLRASRKRPSKLKTISKEGECLCLFNII